MSYLRLIVLKFLSKRGMSGYSLIKSISENTCWKPSTGSIYPLLISMKKENLLTVREDGRKKVYQITKEGMQELNSILDQSKLIGNAVESLKILEMLSDNPENRKKLQKIVLEVNRLR